MQFLNTLNYSSVNEDSLSEMRALGITGRDRVLCITGSGARTLDLLTGGPELIVSVDVNRCQNHLLALQLEAIRRLEHPELLGFLGITAAEDRSGTYRLLRPGLPGDARDFWDRHQKLIADGVFYGGRWERYFGCLASIVDRFRKSQRKNLFAAADVASQKQCWDREWDCRLWRGFLRAVSSRFCNHYLLRDPGFYLHIPEGFSVYEYFTGRLNAAAANILFNRSPFAELLFFGRLSRSLPPYLRPENFPRLKERISAVRIVTRSLADYLASVNGEKFSAFSLSDVCSYTEAGGYRDIWEGISRVSGTDARICERQFLVKRDLPETVRDRFARDRALQEELDRTDGSIFYTFSVYGAV